MAALGGVLFLLILLGAGTLCILPAAAGLIACHIYRKKKGRPAHLALRILLWAVLAVGAVIAAVPLMYLYLILANW
ncbi:MAG: hypothetical protein ACI4XW_12155 [Candidatus Spyradocola sp.]